MQSWVSKPDALLSGLTAFLFFSPHSFVQVCGSKGSETGYVKDCFLCLETGLPNHVSALGIGLHIGKYAKPLVQILIYSLSLHSLSPEVESHAAWKGCERQSPQCRMNWVVNGSWPEKWVLGLQKPGFSHRVQLWSGLIKQIQCRNLYQLPLFWFFPMFKSIRKACSSARPFVYVCVRACVHVHIYIYK